MAKSAEYPALPWVSPASWENANRTSVQLIVIHTTEGSATSGAAENGAAYDARRTDGTSCHFFHDIDSTVQCVATADIAYSALYQGNRRGIHHELCTRAGSAKWSDSYHQSMLRRAAAQCARDAKKWKIPVRKLTPAEVAAGTKGLCGHADISKAFPADGGDHTDPGSAFPWSQFITMVREAQEEDGMPTPAEYAQANASKMGVDLANPKSSVYLGMRKVNRDAVREFFWDATHALRADAVYQDAPEKADVAPDGYVGSTKTDMRNALALTRDLIKGYVDELLEEREAQTPPVQP